MRPSSLSGIGHLFRALSSRNYRLFFIGQSISLTGLWVQRIAMSWLVYRLTDSPFMLGAVEFATQIPCLFLGLLAGTVLEGRDLRKIIIVCQFFCMAHALALAALTLSGTVTYWHVLILGVLLGIVNSFELPARQSYVIDLVGDPANLSNALALNSSIFNLARLIGPSIGGMIIAAAGEGVCFLTNGVCYLATLGALLAIRTAARAIPEDNNRKGVLHDFRTGWRYATNFLPIRNVLVALVILSFAGIPYLALLPVFAREILSGGPQTLGILLGATGVGALTGSLTLAIRKSPVGLGKTCALSQALFGAFLAAFALSRWLILSVALMIPVGFFLVSSLVSTNTLIQTLVDDDKRSRMMSLYILAQMGFVPLGSLLLGWMISQIGAPATFVISGTVCLLAGLALLKSQSAMWKAALPVYRAKGLLR